MTNQQNPQSLDVLASGRSNSDPFITFFSDRDPTPNDINYPIQKRWFNTDQNDEWILVSFTSFNGLLQANWQPVSQSSADLLFLSGNSGGMVDGDAFSNINVFGDTTTINVVGNPLTHTLTISTTGAVATSYDTDSGTAVPSLGVLNVLGGPGISTSGAGNTITITNTDSPYYSLTPYIVGSDVHSQYTTISDAITAGVLAGVPFNVYVKPGTYIEDITLPADCNIVGFGNGRSSNAILVGRVSASYAGTSSIIGMHLQTNSDNLILVSGANATVLNIENCFINCLNNTGISLTSSNAATLIAIQNCSGDIGTTGIAIYTSSSVGTILFNHCNFSNTGDSSTPSSASSGVISINFSVFQSTFVASSTAVMFIFNTSLNPVATGLNMTALTTSGSAVAVIAFSNLNSGTASDLVVGAGTIVSIFNSALTSSNANAATGAGTLNFGLLVLTASGATNVTTQNPFNVKVGNPV